MTMASDAADEIMRKRISEVIQGNTELDKRISFELQIAVNSTSPTIKSVDGGQLVSLSVGGNQVPLDTLEHVILLYRIIYSTPAFKAEIEDKLGRSIGWIPPFQPNFIRIAFRNPYEDFYQRLEKLFCVSLLLAFPVTFLCLVVFQSPWCSVLIFSYILALTTYVSKTKRPDGDRHCECCSCGLTTRALEQKYVSALMTTDTCHNCQGTAICRVGCSRCCPEFNPRDQTIHRMAVQEVLQRNPALDARFKRYMEDTILDFPHSPGTELLTKALQHKLIILTLDNHPEFMAEISVAASENDEEKCLQSHEILPEAMLVGPETESLLARAVNLQLPIVQAHAVAAYINLPAREENDIGASGDDRKMV